MHGLRMTFEDIPLPGPWNRSAWCPLYGCFRSPFNLLKKLNCLQCRSSSWGGFEFQGAPKGGEKTTHHQIATQQLLRAVVIRWACQFSTRRYGCPQSLWRDAIINALEQGRRILCLVKNDLSGLGEHLSRSVLIVYLAQAILIPFTVCGSSVAAQH